MASIYQTPCKEAPKCAKADDANPERHLLFQVLRGLVFKVKGHGGVQSLRPHACWQQIEISAIFDYNSAR